MVDEDCPSAPTTANSHMDVGCFGLLNLFVVDMTTFTFYVSLVAESLQLASSLAALYTSKATQNRQLQARMKQQGLLR